MAVSSLSLMMPRFPACKRGE